MAVYEVGVGHTYETINDAISEIADVVGNNPFTEEQIVRVYSGTYAENVFVWGGAKPTAEYPLTIEVASGNSVTINGTVSIYSRGIIFEGFNLVGGGPTVGEAAFTVSYISNWNTNGVIIRNNTISQYTNAVLFANAKYVSSETFFYNNVVYNCAIAISLSKINNVSATFRVYNNTIYAIETTCACGLIFPDPFPDMTTLGKYDFKNNIVYMDGLSDDFGGPKPCFFYRADYGLLGSVMDYNDFYYINDAKIAVDGYDYLANLAAWQSVYSQDMNSIELNPLVNDVLTYDFHLQEASPCRGIGTDLSVYFTTDKDGNSRTAPWDMGAYIYATEPPPPPPPPEPKNKAAKRVLSIGKAKKNVYYNIKQHGSFGLPKKENIVAFYRMQNSNITDETDNNFRGSNYGTGGADGILERCREFTKTNSDYIRLGDGLLPSVSMPFSVIMWVYPTSVGGDLMTFYTASGQVNNIWINKAELTGLPDNSLTVTRYDVNGPQILTTDGDLIKENSWNMIAFGWDSTKIWCSVNYGQRLELTAGEAISSWTQVWLGKLWNISYFNGRIDEVIIWHDNLTKKEIIDLYSDGNPERSYDGLSLRNLPRK